MRPVYWLAVALDCGALALLCVAMVFSDAKWALHAVVAGYMCGVSVLVLTVIDVLGGDR